jgi:hypothetical protein
VQRYENTEDPLALDDGWLTTILSGYYYDFVKVGVLMFWLLVFAVVGVIVFLAAVNRAGEMVQPVKGTPFVDARPNVLQRR